MQVPLPCASILTLKVNDRKGKDRKGNAKGKERKRTAKEINETKGKKRKGKDRKGKERGKERKANKRKGKERKIPENTGKGKERKGAARQLDALDAVCLPCRYGNKKKGTRKKDAIQEYQSFSFLLI